MHPHSVNTSVNAVLVWQFLVRKGKLFDHSIVKVWDGYLQVKYGKHEIYKRHRLCRVPSIVVNDSNGKCKSVSLYPFPLLFYSTGCIRVKWDVNFALFPALKLISSCNFLLWIGYFPNFPPFFFLLIFFQLFFLFHEKFIGFQF